VPKAERGKYPLIGSVQGYIRYLKESTRSASRSSEHQRLARAQSVKVEMENRYRAGQYIMQDQVHEMLSVLLTNLVATMEGIPGRTANEYAASDDPAHIRRRQQDELRNVRTVIADSLDEFAQSLEDRARDSDDDKTAEAADAERVGERMPVATSD
jgi:phage terminase Nu1 subunit (DNA packaging protein)